MKRARQFIAAIPAHKGGRGFRHVSSKFNALRDHLRAPRKFFHETGGP
jgi:hypothetical protein